MFEKSREEVVYPSAKEYQKSDQASVNADWAGAYISDLAKRYPGARVTGWASLRVTSEVTKTDEEILREKLAYVKAKLALSDDEIVKELLKAL